MYKVDWLEQEKKKLLLYKVDWLEVEKQQLSRTVNI